MRRGLLPHPAICSTTISNKDLKALLELGFDPNSKEADGLSALHLVGKFPNKVARERITLLLSQHADINASELEFGNTPLHTFVANERVPELKFFIEEAKRLGVKIDFNVQDKDGKNCLLLAAKTRNEALAIYLLEQADSADFKIDLADKAEMTCLHYACALGMPRLAAALIGRGASMTCENAKKRQPLDCTVTDDVEIKTTLLSVAIDPTRDEFARQNKFVDESNQTLMTIERGDVKPHTDLFAKKSNRKALETLTRKIMVSCTALLEFSFMTQKPDLIKWLTEHKLTADEKAKILAQADVMSGTSCLQAVKRDQPAVRDVLIARGANYSWLVRFYAATNHSDLPVLLSLPTIAEYINQSGLPSKKTALHQAAAKGFDPVCQSLIQAGADLNIRDVDGNSPMMLACLAKKSDTVLLFARAGADVANKNVSEKTIFKLLQDTGQSQLIQELTEIINKRPAPGDTKPSTPTLGLM